MNLSYDAKTIFFSARRRGVAGGWHIYEIGLDGKLAEGGCQSSAPDRALPTKAPGGALSDFALAPHVGRTHLQPARTRAAGDFGFRHARLPLT